MEEIVKKYNYAVTTKSDPRVDSWLLMSEPWTTAALVTAYLLAVTLGPRWMASRPAFQLNNILILYNFGLVLLSVYMAYEFFMSSFMVPGFSMACQPVDYSDEPNALRLASVCWWYFFSKIIEFMDTIFFVVRKKNNQISFLHVYHHASMVALWWIGVKFVPGGEGYFSAFINCLVHILMYTYYLLSAFGPHMQKYLWWKRYMTSIQLGQFLMVLFHTLYAIHVNCGYPTTYMWALVAYMISHILLFSNFYHKTYIIKKKSCDQTSANRNGAVEQNGHAKKHE